MARLIAENGSEAGMVYSLREDIVTLGRSASSSIQVVDKRASRHHLTLTRTSSGYMAEDLNSKNGTLVNDKVLTGPVMLSSGDRILLGDTVLVYERDPGETEEPRADSTKSGSVKLVSGEVGAMREEVRIDSSHPLLSVQPVLRDVLADPFERLKVIYQVADSIRSEMRIEDLLRKIMNALWNVVNPYRGVILLRDETDQTLEPVVVRTRDDEYEQISISSGIVERCMEERVAILVKDAPSDMRFSANESVIISKIKSVICAPLVWQDDVLGVLYIDSQTPGAVSYTNDELELVTGIANQAALAITNARLHRQAIETQKLEKELEIARTIQMNLLPRTYPDVAHLSLSAMSMPAKQVGGDYYDYVPMPDGRLAIVMADVSGKGVAAAILSATVRASIRTEAHASHVSVQDVVATINQWTCSDTTNDMFVTMFYAIYDPVLMTLEYTNAGHCFPLLFHADGTCQTLEKGGPFLGIMEQQKFESECVPLAPGDTLIFYTDGITDSHNSERETFGTQRLHEVITRNLNASAEEMRDRIYEATEKFRGGVEQFDDLSILVMKVRGSAQMPQPFLRPEEMAGAVH